MKKPYLFNLIILKANETISIVCSVGLKGRKLFKGQNNPLWSGAVNAEASSPLKNINLLGGSEFKFRVIGLCASGSEIYNRTYESDSFGNFEIKIPTQINQKSIERIVIYEISIENGIEFLMGSYIPTQIKKQQDHKLVISDFDKTLVDTKYSTPKEIYFSLSKPVTYFPKVDTSITLLKKFIDQGFTPFILSASPHFYENAIRDWLYLNNIYTNNIFLKDYRKIFSVLEDELTTKDLKTQGFYKLNHLVSILLMTGIPNEIVLMGDGFESDKLIYLTLAAVLIDRLDPWKVWNQLKKQESFKLTAKQNVQFLSKFYQLVTTSKNSDTRPLISIHIRCTKENIEQIKAKKLPFQFLEGKSDLVSYYIG
jgi:hypothetical protein